ncbi:hypothetical protein JYK00_00510 [Thermosipho ferrireducens]|uniref:Uncharacterized protein n=1 Tax=Thermosipho ferrireducens TaxID=2571116 RepID=A0ABX7S663_9BACT|nr:hypothetical protein [Thermosipho ferrireducens]QTA38066.1 hypothetical protein JYK00_00510 [Thermosipho ferrireducens]
MVTNKFLSVFEIVLIVGVTIVISLNRWFSILYFVPIFIEVYKDMFSKRTDEFERLLKYKTSNITLYVMIMISALFLLFSLKATNDIFYFYILFPLLLKNLLYIGYIYQRNKVIKVTGYTLFAILSAFTLLSHGFTLEGLMEFIFLPLLLLISTWIALRFRWIGSILFSGWFLVLSFFIFRNEFNVVKILVYSLLGTPLLFLGIQSFRKEGEL